MFLEIKDYESERLKLDEVRDSQWATELIFWRHQNSCLREGERNVLHLLHSICTSRESEQYTELCWVVVPESEKMHIVPYQRYKNTTKNDLDISLICIGNLLEHIGISYIPDMDMYPIWILEGEAWIGPSDDFT